MTNIIKKENGQQPAAFGSVIDQIFQNNLSRFFDDSYWGFTGNADVSKIPVNIQETETSYELDLVAPGLQKQDFKLNVTGNVLTISFEDKKEHKEENKKEKWIRQEFRKRAFTRSFTLDDSVETSNITARYENGVLHLSLPKNVKAQQLSRQITIN